MKGQTKRVYAYMQRFGSITPFDAFADLGVMRLAARVWDLRKAGVEIKEETVHAVNRCGRAVRYARYRLAAPKPVPVPEPVREVQDAEQLVLI